VPFSSKSDTRKDLSVLRQRPPNLDPITQRKC
jgi:hypothetical protein